MPVPLLGVLGASVVAGVGFTLGKRIVTRVIGPQWEENIGPWLKEQAENFNQWANEATKEWPGGERPRGTDYVPDDGLDRRHGPEDRRDDDGDDDHAPRRTSGTETDRQGPARFS